MFYKQTFLPLLGEFGRPYKTYIDVLSEDAGLNPAELKIAMQDRDDWRRRVNLTRAIRPIR